MVSYFVPRGRFLIKAGHLRHGAAHQKQAQQQQQTKWPILQRFSSKSPTATTNTTKDVNIMDNTLLRSNDTISKSIQIKDKPNLPKQDVLQKRRNVLWRWTGFLLRWAPMGVCVFGAIEWQLHKQRCDRRRVPRTASEFQTKVYCSLPLRIISRCWGWLAACYMPMALRPYVYGWYSNAFNVNLDEALHPDYKHYSSLAEFFTRPLKEGARQIDENAPLVSPADGKVLYFGSATDSLIEQVKGVNYSIESFLGSITSADGEIDTGAAYAESIKHKKDGTTALFQCVIYLAPGDYHRFHSPTVWQPMRRRHFSGELLSVSPKIATWLPGLFCLNERALYMGKWKYGFFSYTAVGATNVGSVQIYMDDELKTNRWVGLNVGRHKKFTEYDELVLSDQIKLNKGELVGQFNMGSTIVLLFEAPKTFKFDIVAGQKIRVGESLGHIIEGK